MPDCRYNPLMGEWEIRTSHRGKPVGRLYSRSWIFHFETLPRRESPIEPHEDRLVMLERIAAWIYKHQ